MPRVEIEFITKKHRGVLNKLQAQGLTINASGDFKIGDTVVTTSKSLLIGEMIVLGLSLGENPIGSGERVDLLKKAQGLVRKLGVDRVNSIKSNVSAQAKLEI